MLRCLLFGLIRMMVVMLRCLVVVKDCVQMVFTERLMTIYGGRIFVVRMRVRVLVMMIEFSGLVLEGASYLSLGWLHA